MNEEAKLHYSRYLGYSRQIQSMGGAQELAREAVEEILQIEQWSDKIPTGVGGFDK